VLKPDENNPRSSEPQQAVSSEELSALATHLLETMEGERHDLAKRLHDELGGMITAAKMDMAYLSARIGATLDTQSTEKFNSVVQMLNQAMMLKRRVVEDLRPSLLEHFGLGVAMSSHFDETCKAAGIDCITTMPEEALELRPMVQLTLFRVAQDVLNGVLARGGARNVEVVLEPDESGYLMTIGDDGAPMDMDLVHSMPTARHRLAIAGGRIEAETRAGAGNQVRVYVPRSTAESA
jgi:signal transduction histidine kinase